MAQSWCVVGLGLDEALRFWQQGRADNIGDAELCVVASWIYDAVLASLKRDGESSSLDASVSLITVERYVRERLASFEDGAMDFFAASAGIAMEAAHMGGMPYYEGPLSTATLVALRTVEISVLAQRNRFEHESTQVAIQRSDWLATHPNNGILYRTTPVKQVQRLSVPPLSIRTFGHLELHIGDDQVDPAKLKMRNVRALIVLLATAQGREIPRDTLSRSMWPNSSLESARKNLYSIWSKLRNAVSLPDGSCPYLISHRTGCSIDASHVQSDIGRLESICRAFLFEEPDFARWSDYLAEINRDFTGDLLPSETENELVVKKRQDYRSKLVDALVVASSGIVRMGNARRAVWCAQMAVNRDDTREDAYVALMRAQIAAGQRTAAMATCRECCHALSEKLGIDPSPETMRIYQQLLDSDEPSS